VDTIAAEIFLQAANWLCTLCIADKPTQYRVYTHNTTLIWLDCWSSSEDRCAPDHSLCGAQRNISAVVSTFQHSIGGFSHILIAVLIHVQLCDCGSHYRPFWKRCFRTTVKTPSCWHSWSVATGGRRFCASVVATILRCIVRLSL
jgi:hypothetical protein